MSFTTTGEAEALSVVDWRRFRSRARSTVIAWMRRAIDWRSRTASGGGSQAAKGILCA